MPAFLETGLVNHGFSTRIGGVSQEPFQSLNLGFHTGDDWEKVKANRELFTASVGIPLENVVGANQVHGDRIFIAGLNDRGKGALEQETAVRDTDAIITREKGIGIMAFYADCVPLMFLDPVERVIAIAHAGWKGTILNIGLKTVKKMVSQFGCKPRDILAAIGPSIGPCHYEVDTPVISQFQNNLPEWEKILKIKDDSKAQLNLWEANRLQFLKAGILEEKISVAEICTYCHPELLYSYRGDAGKTGRLAGIIMLL